MPFHGFQSRRDDQIGGFNQGRGHRCGARHQGGPGRGQRGAGRKHDAARLRLAALAVLANRPGNGLAVMRALAAQGFCPAEAEASTVYPTLRLLTDMGMISANTEPTGQTVYSILDDGAAVLASNRPLINAIMAGSVPRVGRSSGQGRDAGRRMRHRCESHTAPGAVDHDKPTWR
jgi:DNA-binding PadR family transcriptional regulator